MSQDDLIKTNPESTEATNNEGPLNFIHQAIDEDLREGQRSYGETIHTRFPPEPNGYLHIGHAKALNINFSTAEKYSGLCNLRMDDTNPVKEDEEFVQSIQEDIHWLGYDWGDRFYHASDYFPDMYRFALELIEKGLAYVDEQSPDEIREGRGTLTEPGVNSPYRERPIAESRQLFEKMRAGEVEDGAMVLRAKIDMASGNMNMRDPVIYRVLHRSHHRCGDAWPIYPMYDFAHPIEDAMEGISHSLCSLEFEDHRPLYDWVIEHCSVPYKPRQIEFARLGMNYTVMSKRKLRALVEEGLVEGWDDPRMPTLRGLRRRGYTPEAIRNFLERIGVSKVPNVVDYSFLEYCLREDLNAKAKRVMAVLRPLELEIVNYPEGEIEYFDADNNPEDASAGTRKIAFGRHLWIEEEDFMEEPFRKYFRLFPGNEVRLKHAYIIRCISCEKDSNGRVTKVLAEYDPQTRGGSTPDGRKVKSTIHFVEMNSAIEAEVRLYDKLFAVEDPDAAEDYHSVLNPESLEIIENAKLESSLAEAKPSEPFQFIRMGYFSLDSKQSQSDKLVFNRSVGLRDSFKKEMQKQGK
ncbi:MAG: glutamine--tRNA ligase/YqeY domain fusion protein [Eubacteriales bacterium]|nr:glutamine--tRNA ligase/YqeY domain fusion protein [Eubacteriales bacterium]